jgi:hypothetical protein
MPHRGTRRSRYGHVRAHGIWSWGSCLFGRRGCRIGSSRLLTRCLGLSWILAIEEAQSEYYVGSALKRGGEHLVQYAWL